MIDLKPKQFYNFLICPLCKLPFSFEDITDNYIQCVRCEHKYPIINGTIDFVLKNKLTKNSRRERKKNSLNLSDLDVVKKALTKHLWNYFYTTIEKQKIKIVKEFIDYHINKKKEWILVNLGAGAGYDLRLLTPLNVCKTYLASDLSNCTFLIKQSVKNKDGYLGSFMSDLNYCPIKKKNDVIGFIFEA